MVHEREAGFSLTEVMVAALVLGIGAAAVGSVLISALGLTRGNNQRVQAAALVTAEVEEARGQSVDLLAEGPSSRTVVQQGTTFTVQRDVAWTTGAAGTDACAQTSAATLTKTVTVTVTWPDMGSTSPVRGGTQLAATPSSPQLATLPGAVAVQVRDAAGAGVPGAAVVLTGAATSVSATTGSSGCAGFTGVEKGIYQAVASKTGAVSRGGEAAASTGSFTVLAGRVARPRADLDTAGALTIATSATAGGTQRAGVPFTLDAAFFTPTTRRLFPSCATLASGTTPCLTEGAAGSRTAQPLFPGSYRVSGCSTSVTGPSSTPVAPGGSSSATLALATARLTSTTAGGPLPAVVHARPAPTSACVGAPALQVATGSATTLDLPLTDGPWQFSSSSAFTTSVAVTLVASTATPVTVAP
ncbi:type II secretion system protein [Pseudokineococcus sp. 5B2Z-1]|uniref:type IV pilus modification PilV family protein n=1 Tax=Pseudokineococcus sp. 5B2Z-1 TaxID=3132744 RepID=UPI003095F1CB